MELREAVNFSSSPVKTAVADNKAGTVIGYQHRNHVLSSQSSINIQNTPVCHRCGQIMKLGPLSGKRQIWICPRCTVFRITCPGNFKL